MVLQLPILLVNLTGLLSLLQAVWIILRERDSSMVKKDCVILAIDDDPDALNTLRIILETNGYQMVEAYSAEEGLRKYKESKPDFILVDLMMEEVDAGLNFVKEIRLLNNKAPIYMLSSVGDSLTQSTSYTELGLDGVLQKPVDNKTLLKILQTRMKS